MQARARDFAIVIKHWYSIVSVVVALYCKYLVAEIAAALHSALKIGENVFCKFLHFSKEKKKFKLSSENKNSLDFVSIVIMTSQKFAIMQFSYHFSVLLCVRRNTHPFRTRSKCYACIVNVVLLHVLQCELHLFTNDIWLLIFFQLQQSQRKIRHRVRVCIMFEYQGDGIHLLNFIFFQVIQL